MIHSKQSIGKSGAFLDSHHRARARWRRAWPALAAGCLLLSNVAGETYQEPADFVAEAFGGEPPEARVLWLTDELQSAIKSILGHRYPALRIRYWKENSRTAWVLEEIGKEQPITTGLVVAGGEIEKLRVLIFRESRGWEVRYPYFTRQFEGVTLDESKRLDRRIDAITGATLSVNAMVGLARVALYLHQYVQDRDAAN